MISLTPAKSGFALSGVLTRDTALTCQELLLNAGEQLKASALDLSQISSIDSCGLQVLASLRAFAPGAQLLEPSDSVRTLVTRWGMSALLFGEP